MEKKETKDIKDLIDKKTGVIITYPDNKSPKVSVPVSSFPFPLWKEWDNDCKLNYGDCRWAKMWSDHLKSKLVDKEIKEVTIEKGGEVEEEEDNPDGLLNPNVETKDGGD